MHKFIPFRGNKKKGKRRKPPDVKHHQPTVAPSSIIPRPLPPPSRFFPMAVDQPEFMRQNGEPRGHTHTHKICDYRFVEHESIYNKMEM